MAFQELGGKPLEFCGYVSRLGRMRFPVEGRKEKVEW